MNVKSRDVKRNNQKKQRSHIVYESCATGGIVSKKIACTVFKQIDPIFIKDPVNSVKKLPNNARKLLDVILSLGGCVIINPSQGGYLRKVTGLSIRTINDLVGFLADLGLIGKKYIDFETSEYSISSFFTLSRNQKILTSFFKNISTKINQCNIFFNMKKTASQGFCVPFSYLRKVLPIKFDSREEFEFRDQIFGSFSKKTDDLAS